MPCATTLRNGVDAGELGVEMRRVDVAGHRREELDVGALSVRSMLASSPMAISSKVRLRRTSKSSGSGFWT
jgi:hypothetical protein